MHNKETYGYLLTNEGEAFFEADTNLPKHIDLRYYERTRTKEKDRYRESTDIVQRFVYRGSSNRRNVRFESIMVWP